MKQQLEVIRAAALDAIAETKAAEDLAALRVKYLGKKGELTAVLKQMGKLSAEERPVMGQLANDVRAALERPSSPSPPSWRRPPWPRSWRARPWTSPSPARK